MCNVCIAIKLDHGDMFNATSVDGKTQYMISGQASGMIDASPCSYRLCKNGKWTATIDTESDLATIAENAGFNPDKARTVIHDDWIESHFGDTEK